jgi:TatD DNase family protein
MTNHKLVDFHCHLDLYEDFVDLIKDCEVNAIYTLAVTTTPRAWTRNRDLTQNTKYVRAALGLHPQLIENDASTELALWEKYFHETRYIGEIGIDGNPAFSHSINEQKRVFIHILKKCAEAGNKILTVHSVRSTTPVLDLIEEYLPADKGKVVLHWFTGTQAEASRALNLGCYFSVNTAMLETKKGQQLISILPADKLLTETDGPFIQLKGLPIKPMDISITIKGLARLTNRPPLEIAGVISLNLKNLLDN